GNRPRACPPGFPPGGPEYGNIADDNDTHLQQCYIAALFVGLLQAFPMLLRLCLLPVFLLSLALTAARADDATTLVPQTWQMLDYMATDYGGGVENGQVISVTEYAEQQEFSRTAKQHIAALPATPAKAALLADADRFIQLIDD